MIIAYERLSIVSREILPKSLYVSVERWQTKTRLSHDTFHFVLWLKKNPPREKPLFTVGAESIRAGFLYHEAVVLFPFCVQRCLNIKFISAMHLMFIAML